jgi:hypothetical protein
LRYAARSRRPPEPERGTLEKIRAVVVLGLVLAVALVLAACGGGDGGDEDPQPLLNETFGNAIQSGTFDLDFKIEASGGDDPGSFEAKLGGPFQGQGDAFPLFDIDVSVKAEGGSQDLSGSGGLTSTSGKAFVNFQGTDYAVDQELYDQYVSTYTQLQDQSDSQGQGLLATLGINPGRWLTDLKNDGTEEIEGTETIHISGEADVPALIEDLKTIATSAGSAAGNLNPEEFDRLSDTIESADLDVFTGEDDHLLRRLEASLELTPPEGTPRSFDSLTVDLQLTLGAVNQPQTIEAPAGAEPFSALLGRIGIDPAQLGKALRGGLGSGGALPQTGGSTTAPSESATEAYQSCFSQAQGTDALQQCAELLGQ